MFKIVTGSGRLAYLMILVLENGSEKQNSRYAFSFKIKHKENFPSYSVNNSKLYGHSKGRMFRLSFLGSLWALGNHNSIQTIKNGFMGC